MERKGANHELRHNSTDRPDPDARRRLADLVAQQQLGLWSERHRRSVGGGDHRPACDGAPVAPYAHTCGVVLFKGKSMTNSTRRFACLAAAVMLAAMMGCASTA